MLKTNKIAFAYKLDLNKEKFNKKYFEDNYNEKNLNKNICKFNDSDYWGVLVYDSEKDGCLFFKFGKIRAGDTQIIDLKTNEIKKSKLNNWEKHVDISFLAYFPNTNIIINLFNNDAMQYITSPLYRYFKEHIKEEINCNILSRPVKKSDLNKFENINKIEIITAKKNYGFYEKDSKKDPFSKLKDYNTSGTVKLIFSRLGNFNIRDVIQIIWDFKKNKDVKSLIIHGNNFDILNIFKQINIWFPCEVKKEAGIPDFEDFKNKSIELYKNNEEDFSSYTIPQ